MWLNACRVLGGSDDQLSLGCGQPIHRLSASALKREGVRRDRGQLWSKIKEIRYQAKRLQHRERRRSEVGVVATSKGRGVRIRDSVWRLSQVFDSRPLALFGVV